MFPNNESTVVWTTPSRYSDVWTLKYHNNFSIMEIWLHCNQGSVKFHIVSWDPSDLTIPPVLEETYDTTWNSIEKIFKPSSIKGNNPDYCGFWFIPYDTFQEVLITFFFLFIEIPIEQCCLSCHWPWHTRSFFHWHWMGWCQLFGLFSLFISYIISWYLQKNGKGPQYELLKKSTKTIQPLNFVGPLDFGTLQAPIGASRKSRVYQRVKARPLMTKQSKSLRSRKH